MQISKKASFFSSSWAWERSREFIFIMLWFMAWADQRIWGFSGSNLIFWAISLWGISKETSLPPSSNYNIKKWLSLTLLYRKLCLQQDTLCAVPVHCETSAEGCLCSCTTGASLQHDWSSLALFLESFMQVVSDKDTWPFDWSFASMSTWFRSREWYVSSKLTYDFCQLGPSASVKEKHKCTTLWDQVSEMKQPVKWVVLSQTMFVQFKSSSVILTKQF